MKKASLLDALLLLTLNYIYNTPRRLYLVIFLHLGGRSTTLECLYWRGKAI